MRTVSLLVAATAVAVALGSVSGCSGGANDAFSNLPPGAGGGESAARAVGINAVQGARRLLALVSTGFEVPATRGAGLTTAKTPESWGRRMLDSVRERRSSAAARGGPGRQQGGTAAPTFDATYDLFAMVVETDTTTRINFFTDAAGQSPAGFYEVAVQGDPEQPDQFPLTTVITYNISAGTRRGEGAVTLVVNDEQGDAGRIFGRDSNPQTGLSLQLDLAFSGGGAATTGTVSVQDDDGAVEFRNLALNENGFTAELTSAPGGTGTITQNGDGAGMLTLNGLMNSSGGVRNGLGGQTGPVLASWNEEGVGTIRVGAGAAQNVADFDTEP